MTTGGELSSGDLATEVVGTGERRVVMLHGFAHTARSWRGIAVELVRVNPDVSCVLPDLPGHGSTRIRPSFGELTSRLVALANDAVIVGYSMGARIAITLAVTHPEKVNHLILGGVGDHLLREPGLPSGLAEAMEAENIEDIGPPMLKIFRGFAESTRSDLKALAACVRGFRKTMDQATLARVAQPVLICVGTRDDVAGDPHPLQPLCRQAEVVDIPGRDHNRAVGDRFYKQAVLSFLAGESVVPRAGG